MNKILIVDASDSDCRLMSGLLTRAGYEPVIAEDMEAAKQEVAKLSPGAVIVSAMKFRDGTARELINMLSVIQNAPIEAFGNLSETFFNGITPDQMLTPIHLTFRFIGLTPVASFFSSDVMKNPSIPEDLERFKEHLRHYFPFK